MVPLFENLRFGEPQVHGKLEFDIARSVLDRLAHNAYQITIAGPTFRARQDPADTHQPP